jgi:hypothetical protein
VFFAPSAYELTGADADRELKGWQLVWVRNAMLGLEWTLAETLLNAESKRPPAITAEFARSLGYLNEVGGP